MVCQSYTGAKGERSRLRNAPKTPLWDDLRKVAWGGVFHSENRRLAALRGASVGLS